MIDALTDELARRIVQKGRQEETDQARRVRSAKANPSRMQKFTIRIPGTSRGINVPAFATAASAITAAVVGILSLGGNHNEVHADSLPSNPAYTQKIDSVAPQAQVLTDSRNEPTGSDKNESLQKKSDEEIIRRAVGAAPLGLKKEAAEAIPVLVRAFRVEGLDSDEILASLFANVEVESKFKPIGEYDAEGQAKKYDYEGGDEFAGGGYIQITGKDNYRKIGDYLHVDLVKQPKLVWVDKEISGKAVAVYYRLFGTATLAQKKDFGGARKTISQGDDSRTAKYVDDTSWYYFRALQGITQTPR